MGERDLTKMPILQALLYLSLPIIGANLLQIAYQMTDAFWVGRFSDDAFASLTIAGNIVYLIVSFGVGFAIAGSILVSQYFGAKDKKMVEKLSAQSMTTIIIVGLTLGIIGYFLSPYIMTWMGTEAHLYNDALRYTEISFLAVVFNFMFFMFTSILRGIGEVKIPIYIILFGVILNLFIDPMFINGYAFIPALGVTGAAVATLISQFFASSIGMYILFKGNHGIKLRLRDFKPDLEQIKAIIKLGVPSSIEAVSRGLSFTILTGVVSTMGALLMMQTIVVSSYGAASNAFQISVLIGLGLSAGTSVLVGQNAGAGNKERVKKIIKQVSIMSFIMMQILGIFLFIFAEQFIGILIPDSPEIIELGARILRVWTLLIGFIGVQLVLSGVLRAVGDTKTPMYITIFGNWIIKIPFAYFFSKYIILGLDLGIDAIWWSDNVATILTTILMYLAIRKINFKHINITKNPEILG